MPFEYNDQLYIIYSVHPYIILSVDINTGICTKLYESINKDIQQLSSDREIGNSTPAKLITLKDPYGVPTKYFIAIAHERSMINTNITRKMFFYLFDTEPPFDIIRISKMLNIEDEFNYIEFPTGLLVDEEQQFIYISYGVDDCYSAIAKITYENVLQSFHIYNKEELVFK